MKTSFQGRRTKASQVTSDESNCTTKLRAASAMPDAELSRGPATFKTSIA